MGPVVQALLSCSIMPQIYPQETFLDAQSSCDAKKKKMIERAL